jgi:hypothetical protein
MYVPVNVAVEDALSGRPVAGVLVKVLSADGKSVYGEMVTGTDGAAGFLLFGPQRYQVRAFKMANGFNNPTYFDVIVDPAVTNCFRIKAATITVPSSVDPRMCMCSGTFRTPTGAPAAGVDVHFITRFHPVLLDGAGLLTERATARTNNQGWVQVQLVRHGEFDVLLEGYEDVRRTIAVPDMSSCNLPDLIFEVVSSVVIAQTEFQIPVGQTVEIFPQVFTSIGRLIDGTAKGAVCWHVDNLDVASMTVLWDRIVLYGNSLGTAQLTATRADTSIVRIPDPPLMSGIPLLVA